MTNNEINIQEVLKIMRETIGEQSQEIAVLKTVVSTLNSQILGLTVPLEEPKED